jgi:predicted lipid carrier protein YhbT
MQIHYSIYFKSKCIISGTMELFLLLKKKADIINPSPYCAPNLAGQVIMVSNDEETVRSRKKLLSERR